MPTMTAIASPFIMYLCNRLCSSREQFGRNALYTYLDVKQLIISSKTVVLGINGILQ